MQYVNPNPQAKFASMQTGLKRHIGLEPRLRILQAAMVARQPGAWWARTAAYLKHRTDIAAFADDGFTHTGYRDVAALAGPEIRRLVARWAPRCDDELRRHGRDCPVSPFPPETLLNDDTIQGLIFHPRILRAIAAYLGTLPLFSGITLWIGQQGQQSGSPFYHTDSAGWGNARLYVYLSDVGPGCGEFTYVPRHDTETFIRRTGYLGDDVNDKTLTTFFGRDPGQPVRGPAGSAFLIDTTRTLHFGSRCTDGNRYALILNYHRWSAPNAEINTSVADWLKGAEFPADPVARALA